MPTAATRSLTRRTPGTVAMAGLVLSVTVASLTGPSAAATVEATADAPPRMIDRSLELIDRLDATRISVEWIEQPLLRVVTELETVHGVPLTADWESLRELRVQERTVVSVRADDLSAFSVLQMLALQVGDDFDRAVVEPWADRMVLTTSEALPRIMMTDVYDVRDLIDPASGSTSTAGASSSGVSGASRTGERGIDEPARDERRIDNDDDRDRNQDPGDDQPDPPGVLGALPTPPDDLPMRRLSPAESLLEAMLEHVDPEGWARSGGLRGRITERDGVLIISATASTHRNLRRMLDTLRRTDPRGLNLQITMLQVPAGVWDAVDRRYDPSTEIFARRLMAADGVVVRWTQRSAVALDAQCSIRDEPAGGPDAATPDAPWVRLDLRPTFAAESGTLTMDLDLEWRDGGLRTIDTALPIPMLGGAISLALPGSATAAGETVLVILPDRY